MQVVILAGGFGTRISEESDKKPKPMIEIGGKPILWHIMKHYSHFGYNEFIICLGYKGYVIKEYFANYHLHTSDITFDFVEDTQNYHNSQTEPWKVSLIDTGDGTMTGGRVKRIQKYITGDTFMLTYGDGVSDIDINKLAYFHKSHGKLATLTAIQPGGRFGVINIDKDIIKSFDEKPKEAGGWINGGFFVLNKKVFDYIDGDSTTFEQEPLKNLANDGELMAYKYEGFWQAMDTLREKTNLENMWSNNEAKWKVW